MGAAGASESGTGVPLILSKMVSYIIILIMTTENLHLSLLDLKATGWLEIPNPLELGTSRDLGASASPLNIAPPRLVFEEAKESGVPFRIGAKSAADG
jgi:hypothetical protein